MALDVTFTLGMDDSQALTVLRGLGDSMQRSGETFGQRLKSATSGLHDFSTGISRVSHLATGLLTGFGLFGIIQGAVGIYDSIVQKTSEELRLRREIAEQAERAVAALSGQFAGELESKIVQIQKVANDARSALNKDFASTNDRLEAMRGRGEVTDSYLGLVKADQRKQLEEIGRLEDQLIDRAKTEAQIKAGIVGLTQQQREALARGDQEAADRLAARIERENKLLEIERLREAIGDSEVQRRKLAENEIFEQRMKQIDQEVAARRKAEEERLRAEEERARREAAQASETAFRNSLDEDSVAIEKLRLTHQDKAAKLAQEEMEHKRRLHEISTSNGRSDADKARLAEKETENHQLRIDAINAEKAADRKAITMGIGLGGDSLLGRQVFGQSQESISAQVAARKEAERQTKLLKEIRDDLRKPDLAMGARAG